jgi:predicted nucleotidyltransferase
MRISNTEELISRIERALLPVPSVRAALLFGSHVVGHARSGSDVDIGVLVDAAAATALRKPLLWALFAALGRELPAERLDVVVLNDAPSKVSFHVLKEGRVVFEHDPVDLHRFRVLTYSKHADYLPVERFFREASERRGLAAGPRG